MGSVAKRTPGSRNFALPLRGNDQILAVVRGTAANQDGHTVNIATPSLSAQTPVCRAAVAVVEAHGPGTPMRS
jgi:polyketide synthase 5